MLTLPFAPDRTVSPNQVSVHPEPHFAATTLTELTQSELVGPVLTAPAPAVPEHVEPTPDTQTLNSFVHSANSSLYFLPSGTSTVPILTSTGPNYLLPGLPTTTRNTSTPFYIELR